MTEGLQLLQGERRYRPTVGEGAGSGKALKKSLLTVKTVTPSHRHVCPRVMWVASGVVLAAISIFVPGACAQRLQYNVPYKCNGERVVVSHCRKDSDMSGFPATTPNQDYCLVYYPDQPKRGGFTVQTAELRSEVIEKLQACGALAGGQEMTTQPNAPVGNRAEALLAQANQHYEAKDYANALQLYQNLVALTPDTALLEFAHYRVGWIQSELNQYDKAVASFHEAIRLNPGDASANYELGYALYNLKQYSGALAAFQRVVQLKPNDMASALHWVGSTDLAMGRKADARKAYRILQKADQEEANELYMEITKADLDAAPEKPSVTKRAEAYHNLDSASLLAKASQGDDAAMKALADLYYQKHDDANGLQWTVKAAEQGDRELQNDLGWRCENAKNINEARKWYRKAAEQDLDVAQLNLCKSYASELNLDQGVLAGTDKDDPHSPITPIQAGKPELDEAFHWCELAADQGLYLAQWYLGVLNAKGGPNHAPDYAEAYFWLCNGGLQAGSVFREKVGKHLTDAQRADIEKRAAAFRPSPMELMREQILKNSSQQK